MDMARKKKQKQFFAAHTITGNRQHDDEQNERSLGTDLSQLNENENGWKRGVTLPKHNFFNKKLNCQPENIITYNSRFVGKKSVVALVQNEKSLGTNLSQLNEKRKWAAKKGGGGG